MQVNQTQNAKQMTENAKECKSEKQLYTIFQTE